MLGSLVFGWFEFFSFPVRCAVARWLLKVSRDGLLRITVTLDIHIVVFGPQNLSFGRLPLWHPGE